jgi:PhnB protein
MHVHPYICFFGRCAEALDFYRTELGAEITVLLRFSDAPDPAACPPDADPNAIMHGMIRIGDLICGVSDGPGKGRPQAQGFSLTINVDNLAEGERIFAVLGNGGNTQMPFTETFFAKGFGMVEDRFGVSWMVLAAPIPVSTPA